MYVFSTGTESTKNRHTAAAMATTLRVKWRKEKCLFGLLAASFISGTNGFGEETGNGCSCGSVKLSSPYRLGVKKDAAAGSKA